MDRVSIITLALAKAYTKSSVAALEQVVRYIGVTTTAISDGSTTNPITIKGQSVTAVAGDTVFYNGTSYAWDGNAWQEVMNIAEIITAVEALGGRVHDILGDIAPEFNSASAYAVDDVVLYEDDLYIFTNSHTGAWDSEDVIVTSIAQLVDDIRAEIDALDANKAEKTTIAPIENGAKASKNYSFGKYFVKDNKLDKAITSIASGATLTKNTNYTESTIGEELEKINTNIGLGETVSADMANCLPPRFKDISNDFFNGSLRSEIAAGNFRNVRPGDYITYSASGKNFKFVVCDCDYWYGKGDTNCTTHHIRVMLTECTGITELWAGLPYDGGTGHWSGVLRCPWNAATDVDPTSASAVGSNNTNITRNGASAYAGSFVRDRLVTRILPEVFNLAFGSSNVLKVRNLLSNAVDTSKPSGGSSAWNGIASGWGWFDSYLELPSEIELYGSTVFSSSGFDIGCQDKQLAIFKNASLGTLLVGNDVWTKAVVSSSRAASRYYNGSANYDIASRALWAFPLGNIK